MLAHLEPVAGTGEVAAHQVWRGRHGRGALSGEGASVRSQDLTGAADQGGSTTSRDQLHVMEPHDTGPVAVLFPHDPLCSFVQGPLDPHLRGARSAGADLAPPHLPGHGVEIVERGLLPVDIQPAYAADRDLLTLTRVPQARRARMVCESIVTRLIRGDPCWRTATVPPQTPYADLSMHVI